MPLKTLIEFGLSEKEAKLYISLLELEVAGVNEIARKAGINRSSAYVVIESLKKRGLVSVSVDKLIQEYVAASPDSLLRIAHDVSKKHSETKNKIEQILPELKALYKGTRHRPKVMVYDDQEKINELCLSLNNEPNLQKIRVYEDPEGMYENLSKDFIETDCEMRSKKNIKMVMISPNTQLSKEIMQKYKSFKKSDEISLIPKNKFSYSKETVSVTVYEKKVKFYSVKDSFAIIIENDMIAETLKNIFDLAWAESKKLDEARKD